MYLAARIAGPVHRLSEKYGEESPDSAGQPTGEQPGVRAEKAGQQKVPQKITALL